MNFALTGAAGYVAPRHLAAMHETGNRLVAACDPHDSVGILDSYYPQTAFFTEYERFDRHLEKLRRGPESDRVHYISICSPNHLHDAHVRQALRVDAHAICEKPLVINPWNLDALQRLEEELGHNVYTVLQLRVHPVLLALRDELRTEHRLRHRVHLEYRTPRGTWYRYSWKGREVQSGGILMNIGVHLFDLLLWLFGEVQSYSVLQRSDASAEGTLSLARADVDWLLSIEQPTALGEMPASTAQSRRVLNIGDRFIDFSSGFSALHTRVYEEILAGRGCRIEDARPSIELVHKLRSVAVAS